MGLTSHVVTSKIFPNKKEDDHKVDMHTGYTFNHRYMKSNSREVENATWMLAVFNCFGQYFCLHFEAFQLGMAPVYMAFLRFMGDENEARNYSYSLEVVEKTEEELRKEIDELQRQQREITERLRNPRGLQRGGFSGAGPRNFVSNGIRQRGLVRPVERNESDDQPPAKRRLSSAVVKERKEEALDDGVQLLYLL